MKKLGKIFVFCILAAFIAGSAMAQEITLAGNDVGDVLIFPAYAADGTGWETKVTVINTSHTDSVVAKVIVRGEKYSLELLDFLIYLSPNDVWTGKVYNDNGVVKVYSDDDSTLSKPGVWANDIPMDQPVQDLACENEGFGYITVIETWNADLGIALPVPKTAIKTAFDAGSAGDGTSNALTGKYEILLPTLGLSAAENAVALKDYDATTKLAVGNPSSLGEGFATTAVTELKLAEIEKALAKEEAYMPYYNGGGNLTAHLFTFPTKESGINSDCVVQNALGPFWSQNTSDDDWCVVYGLKQYDLQENTTTSTSPIFSPVPPDEQDKFCYEFNASISQFVFSFEEGWALYTFQLEEDVDPLTTVEGVTFTGAPVIPLVLNLGVDGLSLHNAAFKFGTDPTDQLTAE